MSVPNLLELHNISKSFGALTALRNLSFHIGEGEVVGLLETTAPASRRPSTSSPAFTS